MNKLEIKNEKVRRFITAIVVLSVVGANAQSISPYVITPFVNEGSAYGMKLQGHLGEVAVSTLNNGMTVITQGFQQPGDVYGLGINEHYTDLDIEVYPNVTDYSVRVVFNNSIEDLKMHLFNSNGQLVFKKNIRDNGRKDILLSALSEGVYFASFITEKYRCKRTVQIIKTNK